MRIEESHNALGGAIKRFNAIDFEARRPLDEVLVEVIDGFAPKLRQLLQDHPIKIQLVAKVRLSKGMDAELNEIQASPILNSKVIPVANTNDIYNAINKGAYKIMKSCDGYMREGSGWMYKFTEEVYILIHRHVIAVGRRYVPTPTKIEAHKTVINVKNNNNECFKYPMLYALEPSLIKGRTDRVSSYTAAEAKYGWMFEGLKYPVDFKQIEKFEKKHNFNIYVFAPSKENSGFMITQRYMSKNPVCGQVIHLLLLSESREDGSENSHYCLIKDINKLGRTLTAHHGKKLLCLNCMNFTSEKSHARHVELCKHNEAQNITYPEEGEKKKFKNFANKMMVPGVIYIDFESILQTCEVPVADALGPVRQTIKLNEHIPCSFCIYLVTIDGKKHKPIIRRVDPNDEKLNTPEKLMDEFYQLLDKEAEKVNWLSRRNKAMIISDEEQAAFDEVKENGGMCHICEDKINTNETDEGLIPVRDHCHVTGLYRGPAHSNCNKNYFRFKTVLTGEQLEEHLQYEDGTVEINTFAERLVKVPVIAHNMRGYDSHIILNYFNERYLQRQINCIPNNMERYMMFEIGNLVFIDSIQFMNSSLDTLSKNLINSGSKLNHFDNYYRYKCAKLQYLNKQKGFFPYEYFNTFDRFKENALPDKVAFNSALGNKKLTDEEYMRTLKVWDINQCETLGDYHDVYLLIDVLLLADIFETFREFIHKTYKLDPCHYFTLPGVAWDAMLSMTKIELEMLADQEMYLFFESGVRGGISMITHRLAKANFPGMSTYDPLKPNLFIEYLDANNLYEWAMIQSLPYGGFKWLECDKMTTEKWLDKIASMTDNDKRGITFEVDIEVPKDKHDFFNDYPLLPTKEAAPGDDPKNIKLMCTLEDKKKYVIHYKYLQEALKHGYKLTKVHRAVEYDQSKWLSQFIDFNTNMRKVVKNDFEKDLFKLMNNAVYGKTLENLRKRQSIKLVTSEAKMLKIVASPLFEGTKQIYSEHMVAVGVRKGTVKLNNLPYLGQAILDLSKTLMADFHYSYIKPKYDDKATLLFTDTDSLCYLIQTDDIIADYQAAADWFDMSEYLKDHPLYDEKNKKVIGKFKDESMGIQLIAFAGMRAKMYATVNIEEDEKKKAKGVVKCVVKKGLCFDDYERLILAGPKSEPINRTMVVIRSHKHHNYTEQVNKVALSSDDNKRYILADGITTRAHSHWRNL